MTGTARSRIQSRIAQAVAGRPQTVQGDRRGVQRARESGEVQCKRKSSGSFPTAQRGTVWKGEVPYKECARCPPGSRLFSEKAFSPQQWSLTQKAQHRACLQCRPTVPKGTRFCTSCERTPPLKAFTHEERRRMHVVCVECNAKAKAKVAVQTKKRLAFFSLEQDHKQRREG